jgi:hypothetical protein
LRAVATWVGILIFLITINEISYALGVIHPTFTPFTGYPFLSTEGNKENFKDGV